MDTCRSWGSCGAGAGRAGGGGRPREAKISRHCSPRSSVLHWHDSGSGPVDGDVTPARQQQRINGLNATCAPTSQRDTRLSTVAASCQRKRLPAPGRDASTCGRRGCRERIGADETPREGGSGTRTALASTRGRASQSARWRGRGVHAHITTIMSANCRARRAGRGHSRRLFC